MKCKHCNASAEWLNELCQLHWERYCNDEYWNWLADKDSVIKRLEKQSKS
jgi:hypothetical protein